MNIEFKRQHALLLFTAIALGMPVAQADAQSGYLTDRDRSGRGDTVVRSGTGLCWHDSAWTPASGNVQCDQPYLTIVPQAAVAVSAPVDARPVVQARAAPERAVPFVPTDVAPLKVEKVILSADMLFDNDSAVVKQAGRRSLDKLVAKLEGNQRVVVPIGYTSNTGSDDYNLALSNRRANSVKTYLVSRGIDAGRIQPSGHGERFPIASNATAAGRAENRRVEIEVMSTEWNAKG